VKGEASRRKRSLAPHPEIVGPTQVSDGLLFLQEIISGVPHLCRRKPEF